MSEVAATLRVQVAYALPDRQWLIALELPAGTTAADAVRASGLAAKYPQFDIDNAPLGIFSRPCAPATRLRDGDRVEIYRALLCDPKQVRRERAAQAAPRKR